MKQLFLVRHGETNQNIVRVFQDDISPLNNHGKSQIIKAAHTLKDLSDGADLIMHSPLLRANESATIIAQHIAAPLQSDIRLVELRNPSLIRGRSYDDPEADVAYKQWLETLHNPQGLFDEDKENYADAYERAGNFLRSISTSPHTTIIAVTHSEFIRILLAHVLIDSRPDIPATASVLRHLKIGNAGIVKLTCDDDKAWTLRL